MKDMKKIVRIGVNLVEGCTIAGGEKAMQHLSQSLSFKTLLEVNPELVRDERPLNLHAIVDMSQRIQQTVSDIHSAEGFPLVFGGDHALAIGTMAGSLIEDLGVLWIDAHGDCNTPESSDTQRIHGMPLATLMHHGHPTLTALAPFPIQAENVLLIGVRDLDVQEAKQMHEWGVRAIMMEEIRQKGMAWLRQEVTAFTQKQKHLHVSFDCDSMDPVMYPGVNTPVPNGFVYDELEPIFRDLFGLPHLRSMDIVEFNPTRDNGSTYQLILSLDQLLHDLRT